MEAFFEPSNLFPFKFKGLWNYIGLPKDIPSFHLYLKSIDDWHGGLHMFYL